MGEKHWLYDLWIDYNKQPQQPWYYFTPDAAYRAALQELKNYVPPPPQEKSWEEQLAELKEKLGV